MAGEESVEKQKYGFLSLMLSLTAVIIIHPIIEGFLAGVFLRLVFTFILISSVYTLSENIKLCYFSLILAVPALLMNWVSMIFPSYFVGAIAATTILLLIILTIVIMGYRVFFSRRIDLELVYGALSIYFLIGIFFAVIFTLIEVVFPGSYYGLEAFTSDTMFEDFLDRNFDLMVYYSFVTLTTLGYGDITPIGGLARAFSVLTAISGQFYIATLVAGLIGMLQRKHIRIEES